MSFALRHHGRIFYANNRTHLVQICVRNVSGLFGFLIFDVHCEIEVSVATWQSWERYVSNSLKKTFEDMDMQNASGAEAFLFFQYFFDFCFKFSTPDLWTFMELYGLDSLKPLQSEC